MLEHLKIGGNHSLGQELRRFRLAKVAERRYRNNGQWNELIIIIIIILLLINETELIFILIIINITERILRRSSTSYFRP